jgi:hypothetical protein
MSARAAIIMPPGNPRIHETRSRCDKSARAAVAELLPGRRKGCNWEVAFVTARFCVTQEEQICVILPRLASGGCEWSSANACRRAPHGLSLLLQGAPTRAVLSPAATCAQPQRCGARGARAAGRARVDRTARAARGLVRTLTPPLQAGCWRLAWRRGSDDRARGARLRLASVGAAPTTVTARRRVRADGPARATKTTGGRSTGASRWPRAAPAGRAAAAVRHPRPPCRGCRPPALRGVVGPSALAVPWGPSALLSLQVDARERPAKTRSSPLGAR